MQLGTNTIMGFKNEVPVSIWTKNFVLLCFSNLALFLSIQMLLPTLPIYILKIGYTQSDVGLVMAFFVFGTTLMRTISGWLVDQYGRKKIMVIGLSITLAITVLYSFSNSLPFLISTRLLHGLALGMAGTSISTTVVDIIPHERIGEGIGYFGLTSTLSMAIAPMIGIWLINAFSYSLLFKMVIVLAFISFIFCLPVSNKNISAIRPKIALTEIPKHLFEKTAVLPSILGFLMALVYSGVLYFIVLYGNSLKIGDAGLIFAAIAVAMFISRPISGKLTDRGSISLIFLISFIAVLISIILICLTNNIIVFLIAGAFNGFGFGFCLPTLQTLAVYKAPVERRGSATATYSIGYELGLGLGAIILGLVAKSAGYPIMFLSTIIPLALAGLIFYIFGRKKA